MKSVVIWLAIGLGVATSGCLSDGLRKNKCNNTSDCNAGNVCVGGMCVAGTNDAGAPSPACSYSPSGGPLQLPAAVKAAACAQSDGPVTTYSTQPEMDSLLTGSWVLCDGPSLGTTDEAGLELTCNHEAYFLRLDTAGNVVRGTGFDSVATWSTDITYRQLNLVFSDGALLTKPAFEDDSRKMRLTVNRGGASPTNTDYVPVPAAIMGAYACARPGAPRSASSTDDFTLLVTGRWLRCSGPGFSWAPTDQGGIELLASGRFHILTKDANGLLRWATGDSNVGTWSVSGSTVHVFLDNGGSATFDPTFEQDPRRLNAADSVFAAVR